MTTISNIPDSTLRLAVVSDALLPWHKGGKETRYNSYLPLLSERGIRVTAFTMKWWPEKPAPKQPFEHVALSRHVHLYTGTGRRSIWQAIFFSISCLRLSFRGKFDILEVDQMPFMPIIPLWIVSKIRRVPLAVTWHEVWGSEYWHQYSHGPIASLGSLTERLTLKLPDHFIAVSEQVVTGLIAAGISAEKIDLLPAGVDTAGIMAAPKANNSPEILFAGRLVNHKRVDLLLDAFAIVRQRPGHEKERLGIVGVGPEEQLLKQQVFALGLSGSVVFYGALEDTSEVWSLVKGSRIFVSASEREGYGIAVAEAIAAGVPVIVSDHKDNAARTLVTSDEVGRIFSAGDSLSLSEAIVSVLELATSFDGEVDRDALNNSADFSWDSMASRYAEIVKELVSK